MVKIIKVCSSCGSDDVVRDAWVEWSVEQQEWVLREFYDDSFCNNCEYSGNNVIEDKEITDE